ncbi:ribokinase [Luteimonas aestuarii]|uniref:Ribokinase n=1 Tax=Luteimonas aestuarii TaxID=453837 RepID=A0A4R5TT82_9GAMM|nr:ribokinase [Luteimonas aestuarii]TDK23082.1 ribokinase [Luteimonas aestuarii]
MTAGRVLVAGSANLDYVVRARAIPSPGETVLGHAFRTFPGGKGANQAVAAARAGGADVGMLVALGDDPAARVLEDSLRDAGVALDVRRQRDLPTGVAFICISDDAENAITVAPGANDALSATDLPALDGVDCLLLQLETPLPTVLAYAQSARAAGVTVMLNAAPAQVLPNALLQSVDVLVANEGEIALLSGIEGDVRAAMDALPVATIVVTLGDAGAIARDASGTYLQPAFVIDAIDTTAAGDTFCGVLAAALARGAALSAALREASAASALACTTLGAQSSIPQRPQVRAVLARPDVADTLQALARLTASYGEPRDSADENRRTQ